MFSDHKNLNYMFTQWDLNMRKSGWMEYLEDYDFTLHYHPNKANVVAGALNRKSQGVLASVASRVVDAKDCGIVRASLQVSRSGYFEEFSGYAFPTEQSDRVIGTGHRDIVHRRPGTG